MTLKLELEHYRELEYLVSTKNTDADLILANAKSLYTLLGMRRISFHYSKFGYDLFYASCYQIPNLWIRMENNSIEIVHNTMRAGNWSLLTAPTESYHTGEIYYTYYTQTKNPTRTVATHKINKDKTKCLHINDKFKEWLDNNHISIYELTDEHKIMFEMEKELYFGG